MAPVSMLSVNIWGEPRDLVRRHERLVLYLKCERPDVIAMQELFTPWARWYLRHSLRRDYDLVLALTCWPWPPLISFCPCIVLGVLIKWWLVFALSPYSILLVLQIVLRLFFYFSDAPQPPEGDRHINFMGACTCLSKSTFADVRSLEVTPFPHHMRGYPLPECSLQLSTLTSLLFWYVQHTFFRPHFMITSARHRKTGKQIVIANVHLILGLPNKYRTKQVSMVMERLKMHSEAADMVVMMGDFNAGPPFDDPCFDLLKAESFVDSAEWADAEHQEELYTWVRANKYVEGCDPDMRIDHIWVKHKGKTSNSEHKVVFGLDDLVSDHFGVLARCDL